MKEAKIRKDELPAGTSTEPIYGGENEADGRSSPASHQHVRSTSAGAAHLTPHGQESHHRTWSGGLNLAANNFFVGFHAPWTRPRIQSLEEQVKGYHENNQKFLQRAGKEKARVLQRQPPSTLLSRRYERTIASTSYRRPKETTVRYDWTSGNFNHPRSSPARPRSPPLREETSASDTGSPSRGDTILEEPAPVDEFKYSSPSTPGEESCPTYLSSSNDSSDRRLWLLPVGGHFPPRSPEIKSRRSRSFEVPQTPRSDKIEPESRRSALEVPHTPTSDEIESVNHLAAAISLAKSMSPETPGCSVTDSALHVYVPDLLEGVPAMGDSKVKHKKKSKKYRSKKTQSRSLGQESGEAEDVHTRRESRRKRQAKRKEREKEFVASYLREFEKEKHALIAEWKREMGVRDSPECPTSEPSSIGKSLVSCVDSLAAFLSFAEVFISNMPLTIGAVGLSWVTMGVVWFKFYEEMAQTCTQVHFNSPLCTPGGPRNEFPNCFSCDTDSVWYWIVVSFHFLCHAVGGLCCLLFFLKVILAWRVVADELSNPTTSTPMGVVCITLVCVFAGRGVIGEAIVLGTSWFHVGLAFWFYYMAIFKYSLLPDPSWFPNTVGLAYASIKTWLYYPVLGKIFMGLCTMCFFGTFFVSLFRVAVNKKISAPVCWIQLSAPSITLYAMTILAQPSMAREEQLESSDALSAHFFEIHHKFYMPLQHLMMFLSLLGMASALHSLWRRWDTIQRKEFSPAHAAFCFPTLSHTNAVQAYRGAVNTFSTIAMGSRFKIALWLYWFTCLIAGTIVNFVFTYYYVSRLPKWTKVNIAGEDEPPPPEQTIMHEMQGAAGEQLVQNFVSPAVLQANEAGALVRVRRGTEDWNLHGP